jgi:translin
MEVSMNLDDLLERFRSEIDSDDKIREKVLPIAREAVRKCSESIKRTHRKDFVEARKLLVQAHKLITQGQSELEKSEFLSKTRVFDTAYQELVEANYLLSILQKGKIEPTEEYDIPSRPFMTGLADTIGELRRATLDAIRNEMVEDAEQLLSIMEEILEALVAFDYPNALIPELRRKCDIARSIVERTRGDVTTSIQTARLVKELRSLDK